MDLLDWAPWVLLLIPIGAWVWAWRTDRKKLQPVAWGCAVSTLLMVLLTVGGLALWWESTYPESTCQGEPGEGSRSSLSESEREDALAWGGFELPDDVELLWIERSIALDTSVRFVVSGSAESIDSMLVASEYEETEGFAPEMYWIESLECADLADTEDIEFFSQSVWINSEGSRIYRDLGRSVVGEDVVLFVDAFNT